MKRVHLMVAAVVSLAVLHPAGAGELKGTVTAVGARNNASKPFWTPILYDAPASWPWYAAGTRRVVLVQGPIATDEETAGIVASAAAQDIQVDVAPHRCT